MKATSETNPAAKRAVQPAFEASIISKPANEGEASNRLDHPSLEATGSAPDTRFDRPSPASELKEARIGESPAGGDSIIASPLHPQGAGLKTYIGVDNGFSGAFAALLPDDTLICRPVVFQDLGRSKLLDIFNNLAILRKLSAAATDASSSVFVIFEQGPITPAFGAKNNYINGQNNEFWRLLLSLEQVPFCWANARQWQKELFSGIRGDDTKAMARLVVKQRFPKFAAPGLNPSQLEGVHDAICLALWARQTRK